MCIINLLLPSKFRKYSTLLGGILIHISLASSHTFGNMSPYIISYLRSYDGFDIRYSNSMWLYTWLGVASSFSTIIGGFLTVKLKLSMKLVTFLGCFLIRYTWHSPQILINTIIYLIITLFLFYVLYYLL